MTEDGPFANDVLTNTYVNRLRTRLDLEQPTGVWTNGFGYDAAKRLTSVVSPTGSFDYEYASDASRLVKKLSLPNTSYITNTHDSMARMLSTTLNNSSHNTLNGHEYGYNAGHQRTNQTFASGSPVDYTYDNIGQLIFADSATASEDRGYFYDTAWNLNRRTNNTTTQTFSVGVKNQLTATPFGSPGYDENGNLAWHHGSADWLPLYRSQFIYDGKGRLRKIVEYEMGPENFDPQPNWLEIGSTTFVYDGRRVIQERSTADSLWVSYTLGNDLSGSMEGAGGIGGMLARSHGYSSGAFTNHNYYHADGNGNITAMVNANESLVATYKYDPFGNTLSMSGSLAQANAYRFSSKRRHVPVGHVREMYYYGYRWYEPDLQRWLNRDPIQEDGGMNLYAFVENAPVIFYDRFGLKRSCAAVCKDAREHPNIKVLDSDGKSRMGGVVCDSDGNKCPCTFQFIVPGTKSDIYHPTECPALDQIIEKHEGKHVSQTQCDPKHPGQICSATYTPKYEPKDRDIHCKLWKEDMKNLEKALKKATGRCADVMHAVLNETVQNYENKCGKK